MEDYKQEYNKLLKRYYDGCKYIESNPNEWDKYINVLLEIKNKMDKLIEDNNINTNNALYGF